MLKWSELWALL